MHKLIIPPSTKKVALPTSQVKTTNSQRPLSNILYSFNKNPTNRVTVWTKQYKNETLFTASSPLHQRIEQQNIVRKSNFLHNNKKMSLKILISITLACLLTQVLSDGVALSSPQQQQHNAGTIANARKLRLLTTNPAVIKLYRILGGGAIQALDDDDLLGNEPIKRQYDDYGHMRFGKRNNEFDDYGHMRFGKK